MAAYSVHQILAELGINEICMFCTKLKLLKTLFCFGKVASGSNYFNEFFSKKSLRLKTKCTYVVELFVHYSQVQTRLLNLQAKASRVYYANSRRIS